MSAREQITEAATELRKLIDRLEHEAIEAIDHPSMERLAAFDGHRRLLETSLTVLRRVLVRRVEREQSRTEPDADLTGPQQAPNISKRPTTRPR